MHKKGDDLLLRSWPRLSCPRPLSYIYMFEDLSPDIHDRIGLFPAKVCNNNAAKRDQSLALCVDEQ
jgi:hypothetical protein